MKKRVILEMVKQAFAIVFVVVGGFYIFFSAIGYAVIWAEMNVTENLAGVPIYSKTIHIIPKSSEGVIFFIGFCIFIMIFLCYLFINLYKWYKKTEQTLLKNDN